MGKSYFYNGEVWQIFLDQMITLSPGDYRTNSCHVPPEEGEAHSTTHAIFLPRKSILIPITKKQSNNPECGSFYKITTLDASKHINVTKDKEREHFLVHRRVGDHTSKSNM